MSGASMNWIADYLTDQNVIWEKMDLPVKELWLTGTRPEWNKVIIDQCGRSPVKLKEVLDSNPETKMMFEIAQVDDRPILVRFDDEKLKVLDGMHRTIAAIREGKQTITAFVAKHKGTPKPYCEPHVVYDLLKAYHRKLNSDKESLIVALRYLRKSYANVDDLLKNRFSKSWMPDDEIQKIIKESLEG